MTAASGHPALRGRPIYLDYNATTPIDPAVVEAMTPYLTREFGNPSSTHTYGAAAHDALGVARRQVAELIAAPADTVVFTGSGSEADALAIRGAVLAAPPGRRRHVITQVTEHPAVLAACRELEELHGCRRDLPRCRPPRAGGPRGGRSGNHSRHGAGVGHAREQRDRHDPAHRPHRANHEKRRCAAARGRRPVGREDRRRRGRPRG